MFHQRSINGKILFCVVAFFCVHFHVLPLFASLASLHLYCANTASTSNNYTILVRAHCPFVVAVVVVIVIVDVENEWSNCIASNTPTNWNAMMKFNKIMKFHTRLNLDFSELEQSCSDPRKRTDRSEVKLEYRFGDTETPGHGMTWPTNRMKTPWNWKYFHLS